MNLGQALLPAAGREPLDPTDLAIIRALQTDGRMPFVRVAELARVSERTVRRRFQRLADRGIVRVVGVANPLTMGYTCPAIMGIQCRLTRLETVVEALCRLRQLRFVGLASGHRDIVVEGYFPSHADLYEFRSRILHRIDGVVDSQVAIVLRIDRQVYQLAVNDGMGAGSSPGTITGGSPGTITGGSSGTGGGTGPVAGGGMRHAAKPPLAPAGPEHRRRLTSLDRAIIEILQQDGRTPYADLAGRLGASQVTVARRVEELLRNSVVRVVAVVNPFALGFGSPAILGLNLDLQRQPEVMRVLRCHPRLTYAAATIGEFDAVVVGYFVDNQDLARFVVHDLARIPGVRRVNTSILFSIAKQTYDWGTVAPDP